MTLLLIRRAQKITMKLIKPPSHLAPSLSIIIPAYEEEARLPRSLKTLILWLDERRDRPIEVLIVVEPGRDRTAQIVSELATKDPRFKGIFLEKQGGKGAAVRLGLLAATGEYRLYMDADLSTGLEAIDSGVAALKADSDATILIGNRQHPQSRILRRQGFLREQMGKTFNRILAFAGAAPFADTQCGFKILTADTAEKLVPQMQIDGFAFDVELLLLARKHGDKVIDHPVEWSDVPRSKVHLIRDSMKMLQDTLRIRQRLGGS